MGLKYDKKLYIEKDIVSCTILKLNYCYGQKDGYWLEAIKQIIKTYIHLSSPGQKKSVMSMTIFFLKGNNFCTHHVDESKTFKLEFRRDNILNFVRCIF